MAARDSRLEISGVVREHHGAATVAALGYNIARPSGRGERRMWLSGARLWRLHLAHFTLRRPRLDSSLDGLTVIRPFSLAI